MPIAAVPSAPIPAEAHVPIAAEPVLAPIPPEPRVPICHRTLVPHHLPRRAPAACLLALFVISGCSTAASGHGVPAPSSPTNHPTHPATPTPLPNPAYPTVTAGGTDSAQAAHVRLRVGQRLRITREKDPDTSQRKILARVSDNLFEAIAPGAATVGGAADVPPPPCAKNGCAYAMPGQLVHVTVVR